MKPRTIPPPNSPLSDAKNVFIISDAFRCVYFLRGIDLQVLSTQYWSQLLPKAYPTDCQTSFLNSLVPIILQDSFWAKSILGRVCFQKTLFTIQAEKFYQQAQCGFSINSYSEQDISEKNSVSILTSCCCANLQKILFLLFCSTLQHLLAFLEKSHQFQ